MYVLRRPIVRNIRESLIITFLASSLYNIIRGKVIIRLAVIYLVASSRYSLFQ